MIYEHNESGCGLPALDKTAFDEREDDGGSIEECSLDCRSECSRL